MNSRLRLLTIERLLLNKGKTSIKEIQVEIFNLFNEKAERKAIYKDIKALQHFYCITKKKIYNDTVMYILERKSK